MGYLMSSAVQKMPSTSLGPASTQHACWRCSNVTKFCMSHPWCIRGYPGIGPQCAAPLPGCRLTAGAGDPHKPLFPLSWSDWVGYGFAAVSLFIAAGGGIGGGGILVPLYILLLGVLPPV